MIGARVSQRRLTRWRGHSVQNTFGVQVRNDSNPDGGAVSHREARAARDAHRCVGAGDEPGRLRAERDRVGALVRRQAGLRADGSRYRVDALDPPNSGTTSAGMVSPKAGATFGPWKGTEFYVNAGTGFHSNNALGTTITRDPDGNPVDRVTPLVRAKGAEVGVRTVAVPHLQATVSLWTLQARLGAGLQRRRRRDRAGPGERAARRRDRQLLQPAQVARVRRATCRCRARTSRDVRPRRDSFVPRPSSTVVSAGASVDNFHRTFGSLRLALLRPALARRGQLGALEGDEPRQPAGRLSACSGICA